MTIKPIRKTDIDTVAWLAAECFADDKFYNSLHPDREQRKELLKSIFIESIHICMLHGHAYYYEVRGNCIAFALWFDYNQLKKTDIKAYNHIFTSTESELESRLKEELQSIEKILNDSREYLYLLAIGVEPSHRRQGIATSLVSKMQEAYPQYNLFADVSNQRSLQIYRQLGFEVLGKEENCTYIRFLSQQKEDCIPARKSIYLALPLTCSPTQFFDREIKPKPITLPYMKVSGTKGPFFCQSLYQSSPAQLVKISYAELLCYQRAINVINFQELELTINALSIIAYVSSSNEQKDIIYNNTTYHSLYCKQCEWSIIPDIYISVPILYRNIQTLIQTHNQQNDFTVNRLLTSLEFRTTYEAGIPVKELDNRCFKYRIRRFYLGKVTVQIQSEDQISFNGILSKNNIGLPVEIGLIVSIDEMTQCGVLHLVSLSCGLPITQLLDSASRNQINIIQTDSQSENFYQYIKREFEIEKKGTAKSFITIPQKREKVGNDLLASILFCETLYADNESIGKVADMEISRKLESPTGIAQYNYASVFAHTNIVIQLSDTLQGSMTERIIKESITLFYIELILFEEAAIHIANDKIVNFLTQLDQYSPNQVLRNINFIISTHVRTIEFWDIQMNYPSSKKSVDDIRRAFKIRKEQEKIECNKAQLLTIYQIRSGIVDRTEASILSAAGVILTVISVIDLITDTSKSPLLSITALLVGILLLIKRFIFQKILSVSHSNKS